MTGVRVLIGTRKGAFVLTSDERRRDWEVSEPHFGGRERARAGHRLRRTDHQRLPALPTGRQAAGLPQPAGGGDWEPLTSGLPQEHCYVNVLRDAMAVDRLDECGVYVGTTGGRVYASADAGDSWAPIVRDLPAVLSVEVQTLP